MFFDFVYKTNNNFSSKLKFHSISIGCLDAKMKRLKKFIVIDIMRFGSNN